MGYINSVLCLLLFICCYPVFSPAQSTSDLHQFNDLFDVHKHNRTSHINEIKSADNSAEFVFASLFVFYKKFISSQDIESCVFTPSCSVYAIQSIRQRGILAGLALSFDRLTRCNTSKHKKYPLHRKTKKYYDPVSD